MTRKETLSEQPTHRGGIGSFFRTGEHTKGFFVLSGARLLTAENTTETTSTGAMLNRCDARSYGPYGFHFWDDEKNECSCGSPERPSITMGHHLITMENLDFVQVVISCLPHSYILYVELKDDDVEEQAVTAPRIGCPVAGRTLQELFRAMIEWDVAHEQFDNNEPATLACHETLAIMNMPPEVTEWLLSEVPAQRVERYLQGETNANSRLPGTPAMAEAFDDWITRFILTSSALGEVKP